MKRSLAAFGAGLAVGLVAYVPVERAAAPLLRQAPERPLTVVFAGDLMLDRAVAVAAKRGGAAALFDPSVIELFESADRRILNLEGTITDHPSIAQRDHTVLRFTFNPGLAREALELLGVDAVSLANNHALDFYQSGHDDTRAALDSWGIASFGHPLNATSTLGAVLAGGEGPLCLVGYHSLFVSDWKRVLQTLTDMRPTCWRVVVFAHWGDEYETRSNAAQRQAAHEFIDAGADLVIGAHPHVVQEVEIYRGKAIFYSLGNFMFDQNFSWETTHGLAVKVEFYSNTTRFVLVPLAVAAQRAAVAQGIDRERVLGLSGSLAEFILP